jgi:methionine aminopeptidase
MTVESDKDLAGLRNFGRVVRLAIEAMKANLQPGMTTAELNAIGAEVLALERVAGRTSTGSIKAPSAPGSHGA